MLEVIDLIEENKMNSAESLHVDSEQRRERKNRDSCSICRNGGDLVLCDNCPKSFHLDCLKLKESDLPDGSWYCTNCM